MKVVVVYGRKRRRREEKIKSGNCVYGKKDLRLADEEGVDYLRNSTIFENLELMGPKTTAWNEFSSTVASAIICLATNQKFNFLKLIFDSMIRNLDNVIGNFLMYPRLVRAATTASSLEAEQDSGNIDKTQSKETPNEASSPGTTLGGGPRGNTLQSDKDRMKLNELMELCTNLQSRVLDLEKTKTTQALEITSMKRRVKKLEKKQRSGTYKLKRLYKVGLTARVDFPEDEQCLGEDASKQGRKINDINADEDITLVNDQDDAEMFDVNDLHSKEVFVEKKLLIKRIRRAPDRMCLYIDVEEHELGDLGEPANYKAVLLDPESKKWLDAMNVEMQSMKDNDVWVLVELPPNARTVGSKWLFKKKTDID
nr:putative retrotransposon Ty1-copia subclass protein [Tanacetum cinerariifolium]